MQVAQLAALGVFCSYFILILTLFSLITRSQWNVAVRSPNKTHVVLFIVLTCVSLAHTWYYMFKYMAWSFRNYESITMEQPSVSLERVASWLLNTSLFEEAWAAVCSHPLNWWWSEQLCLFTAGTWTVFLCTEGKRYNIKHLWAYMLLGQLVAISVASNLFYLTIVISPPRKQGNLRDIAHPKLWLSVLISAVTVALSPFTSPRTFLPNLLLMHTLLVVPLFGQNSVSTDEKAPKFSIYTTSLYRIVFIAAIAMRLRTILVAVASLAHNAQSSYGLLDAEWRTLYSHPAQSSIGWDILWTTISFIVWDMVKSQSHLTRMSKAIEIPYLLLASPVASVGVTAPYILRRRDNQTHIKLIARLWPDLEFLKRVWLPSTKLVEYKF